MLRIWLLVFFLWAGLGFAETAELPELKSNHHDISDPNYFEDGVDKRPSVGKDIEKFGAEVAGRLDKIVSRKGFRFMGDPWTLQGIPLLFPSTDTGFNLGLNMNFANIRREDPHQAEIVAQALASDRGRYKHFLKLDLPHFLDGKYHFTASVNYNRDINFRYFGIGNDTLVDRKLFSDDNFLYQNVRSGPSFNLSFLKHLGNYFSFGPTVGLKWTKVDYPATGLVDQQKPVGYEGGRTHYFGLAAVYSEVDFLPNPTRGKYHELFLNWYAPFMGSEYNFTRLTYVYRYFVPLHRRLVFAHRTFFESMSGDVPFYELGATGGTNSSIGFGGDRYLRGYQSNRFIDQIKMALGFELRWDIAAAYFADQKLSFGIVPFVDMGRVWNKLLPFQLGDIHVSTGWGARIAWNDRFILRTDFAVTPDGTYLYVELGQSF